MLPIPVLSGLVPKILAAVSAAFVGLTAAGAAGALPGPAQNVVAGAVEAVTPFDLPGGSGTVDVEVGIGPGGPGVSAEGEVTAGTGGTGLPPVPGVATPTIPDGSLPDVSLPDLPDLPDLPVPDVNVPPDLPVPSVPDVPGLPDLSGLPVVGDLPLPADVVSACLQGVIDPVTGEPLVALSSVSGQVIACVNELIAGGVVSAEVVPCLSQVLGVFGQPGVAEGSALTGVDLSACVPAGG